MAEAFNRASVTLSTTSITDVYQAPNAADADRAVVLSCLVANIDGTGNARISLTVTNSSNAEIAKIAELIYVPAAASLECIPNKLVLKRGEKIRATADVAGDLAVTVSALEVTV